MVSVVVVDRNVDPERGQEDEHRDENRGQPLLVTCRGKGDTMMKIGANHCWLPAEERGTP